MEQVNFLFFFLIVYMIHLLVLLILNDNYKHECTAYRDRFESICIENIQMKIEKETRNILVKQKRRSFSNILMAFAC